MRRSSVFLAIAYYLFGPGAARAADDCAGMERRCRQRDNFSRVCMRGRSACRIDDNCHVTCGGDATPHIQEGPGAGKPFKVRELTQKDLPQMIPQAGCPKEPPYVPKDLGDRCDRDKDWNWLSRNWLRPKHAKDAIRRIGQEKTRLDNMANGCREADRVYDKIVADLKKSDPGVTDCGPVFDVKDGSRQRCVKYMVFRLDHCDEAKRKQYNEMLPCYQSLDAFIADDRNCRHADTD